MNRLRKRKNCLSGWLYLAPGFLGAFLFYILPFGVVVYYALTDGAAGNFVFPDNFVRLLQNSAFRLAAKNTLTFSVTAVPLVVVLALLLAMALEARIPWKSNFRTALLSPMVVPVASIVLIWQVLFSYHGSANELLQSLGLDKIDWLNSDYGQIVVALLFLWKTLGYNMILFLAALSSIPREQLEAAMIDGASPTRQFFTIKMRYLSSTISFVTVLSLINSFKIFREVYLLAGNYPYESLYTLQHFMNNMFTSLDYSRLSAAAILMAIVTVFIVALLFVLEDRFGREVEE